MRKPRLLFASDGVVHTGFARVAHSLLEHLRQDFDVQMLAAHYEGDPHGYPYPIWPGVGMTEPFGYAKLPQVLERFKPDVMLVLNDPYYVAKFQILREKLKGTWKLVGYMPIDGPNLSSEIAQVLTRLDVAIFYTAFGLQVATQAGFRGLASVIPHGIDRRVFYPRPLLDARKAAHMDSLPGWRDAFIIGNVNRNQPRKRLDLTIAYFADWVDRERPPESVKLYLHCATKDVHIANVAELAAYFGIRGRLMLPGGSLSWARGLEDEQLANTYASLDLNVSTTLGEGWGLTTMEAMASGVPNLVPDWGALHEWASSAAMFADCSAFEVKHGLENSIGGVVDRESFVNALDLLYKDAGLREQLVDAGLSLVRKPEYEWPSIAQRFGQVLHAALDGPPQEAVA